MADFTLCVYKTGYLNEGGQLYLAFPFSYCNLPWTLNVSSFVFCSPNRTNDCGQKFLTLILSSWKTLWLATIGKSSSTNRRQDGSFIIQFSSSSSTDLGLTPPPRPSNGAETELMINIEKVSLSRKSFKALDLAKTLRWTKRKYRKIWPFQGHSYFAEAWHVLIFEVSSREIHSERDTVSSFALGCLYRLSCKGLSETRTLNRED